ncbi:hypothetical protein [Cohnella luojiensis]|uniref:hypothetical protein n=1 Tax=Cohnella luojiensis TaxID=652876 RepID=UPI00196BA1BD|nr:hypothetical protein [Cohnella luojiensis]
MTVLIVDDNAMNVMVIQEMLKRAGYDDFRIAYSAEERPFHHRPESVIILTGSRISSGKGVEDDDG